MTVYRKKNEDNLNFGTIVLLNKALKKKLPRIKVFTFFLLLVANLDSFRSLVVCLSAGLSK